MLFNSYEFGLFLVIVFAVYWSCPDRFRRYILLFSSLFFYMCWNAKYILLILGATVISYGTAIIIDAGKLRHRKLILAAGITADLAILFFFKYFNFVCETIESILGSRGHIGPLDVILPVGISFYTFQTIGYMIDVYRRDIKAERSLTDYALYVSFFPQLVAGPIERTGNLLPQLKERKVFSYDRASYGLKLMVWGYYKKLVIADVLAPYVDTVYADIHLCKGVDFMIALFFFAIQIYCDFSGYSDIAIGTAKLFGIDLMKNFSSPYFAVSVRDFWKRWHISLTSWFRDYVYIPMGGNRKGFIRTKLNMLAVFLLSGLWHGSAWHFVFWGGLNGVFQMMGGYDRFLKKHEKDHILRLCSGIVTFILVSCLWVFFRAEDLSDALYVLTHIFEGFGGEYYWYNTIGLWPLPFAVILFSILILLVYDALSLKHDVIKKLGAFPLPLRYMAYTGILMMILLFKASGNAEFVYFQF